MKVLTCETCGYHRYDDDMHNGDCATCVAWAENEIRSLRAALAETNEKLEAAARLAGESSEAADQLTRGLK